MAPHKTARYFLYTNVGVVISLSYKYEFTITEIIVKYKCAYMWTFEINTLSSLTHELLIVSVIIIFTYLILLVRISETYQTTIIKRLYAVHL